jgi:glycosyltransferase involved in cell wall biosynthesis
MKICYLADGRYIHAHRWLKFFTERGHQMSLLSFAGMQPHHIEAVENSGARYLGELEPFHLKRFWRTTRQLKRLRKIFRREKIDIVHSHFLGVNAWYGALSRFHPTVITVMGGDILGENWKPGDDIRERWLTPFALHNADLITCWSSKLTKVVERYTRPGIPIEVIHGGVDTEWFRPGPKPQALREELSIPADAKVILSPRLMRPLYNLDKIALAAAHVWAQVPNAYFVFAVLPEAKDLEYERQVREILSRDTAGRVRFLDAIPHERMADYYRLADVTISIPSSDGTPMSVLESMACGTPVVCGDISDYDTQHFERGKTVQMANVREPLSVAEALTTLMQDGRLATRMADEARRRVIEYGSYEAQMGRMEQLYRTLAMSRRSQAVFCI